MTSLDYWVIIIFSLGILAAGLALSDRKASMTSFFAAGGAVPWWMNGLSLYMSFFSAGTFVVWGAIAYEHGWVAVVIQWTMAIGGFFIGYFIAPKWKEKGALTAAEFIHRRFGPGVQKFYTYIFLLMSFAYSGSFLYPVAKLVNVSTGFPVNYAIIIFGVMSILYTTSGGLLAVIVTNVLQFVVLTAAVLIIIPLALERVGGVGDFVQQAPDGFFNLFNEEYSIWFMIAFGFYNMVFIGGNWAYVQRYTSVASKRSAKKVGYLFGWLYVISPVIWMLPPMIFRLIGQDLTGLENEGAYLLMCKEVLPAGILGLMITGMVFATTDSVNSGLNVSAAVFTNDIYKNLFPRASNRSLMLTARLSTVAFGVVTILAALMVPGAGGIVEVVLSIGALTGVPLYGPPIWALFSKRLTSFSIYFTTVFSLVVNLFFKFLAPVAVGISLDRTQEMVLGVSLPLVLLIFFEVWYALRGRVSPDDVMAETADGSPVDAPGASPAKVSEGSAEERPAASEEEGNKNQLAIRVIGVTLLCTGLLIFGLGLIAPSGKLWVIIVASIVMLFALYLLRAKKVEGH